LTILIFEPSCVKEKNDPSAKQPVIDTVLTLQQLKSLPPEFFDSVHRNMVAVNASVYATVTMDESQGNIYKQLYIQDADDAFSVVFDDETNVKTGDSVRIDLKGATVEIYHDAWQISTLSALNDVTVLARNRFIEPEIVTIEQINSRQYDLKLVKLEGVEFRDKIYWGDYLTFSTLQSLRDLYDCTGQTCKVLTSGHATFAAKILPTGNGSLVAIASVYNATMQLLVRNIDEVLMTGTRCDGTSGDDITLLNETFAGGQGSFTISNVIGTEQTWNYNSNEQCMQMTKSTVANEDWLISPPIDMTDIALSASVIFDHAIANIPGMVSKEYMKQHQTVWISSNYTSGQPIAATWTEISLSDENLPLGTNWTMTTANVSIPNNFLGKEKIHIAFKYTCDNVESATWRIKNIIIRGK
jgi:hypothetical protein